MNEYNLNFMHPQYGTTLNVDIDGSFTIEEMIDNLLLSGFIGENKAGYDLALREHLLDRTATFEEIQELYDGAVIRIVAHTETAEATVAQPTVSYLTLHIKHPSDPLVLDLRIKADAALREVIESVVEKHFIDNAAGILNLQKGGKLLDLDQSAPDNAVSSGDYLQLIQAEDQEDQEDPLQTAVGHLDQKLQALEAQIAAQLENIKNALPQANMIPIDPTRAVNPTMDTYESIDTIVTRLRSASKQAPLRPIRPLPMNLIIGLAITALIIIIVALKLTNII